MLNFLFEMLLDFSLPSLDLVRRGKHRPVDSHAQCQGMLMLARERNQVLVPKHASIIRHSLPSRPTNEIASSNWQRGGKRLSRMKMIRRIRFTNSFSPLKMESSPAMNFLVRARY